MVGLLLDVVVGLRTTVAVAAGAAGVASDSTASSAFSSVSTFLNSVDLGTCSREVAGLTKACEVDD